MADPSRATPPRLATTAALRSRGVAPWELRRREYTDRGRSLWGAAGVEFTLLDHVRALQELHPTGVFSHATAARLWGMWLPRDLLQEPSVDIAKVKGRGGWPSREGIRGHHLDPAAQVVRLHGVRVTSPAWTWVDLAARLSVEDLVVAGDSLLPDEHGATARSLGRLPCRASTVAELRRTAATRKNVRGVVRARHVVGLLREGADSPAESRLRHRIVEAGFPEPEVNPALRLHDGRIVRPDLCWRALRMCLEFDGDHHRTERAQWQEDRARRRGLEADGWSVTWVAGEVFTRAGWGRFRGDLAAIMRRQAHQEGVVLPPSLPGEEASSW